jgi:hypothetical protein
MLAVNFSAKTGFHSKLLKRSYGVPSVRLDNVLVILPQHSLVVFSAATKPSVRGFPKYESDFVALSDLLAIHLLT